MNIRDITEESVKTIGLIELESLHKFIHSLWGGLKNLLRDDAAKQMALLKQAHDIIVVEFAIRSEDSHPTPLEKSDVIEVYADGSNLLEVFKGMKPWQIEDAGIIVRVLQKYFCKTVLDVGCGVGWLLALLDGWFTPTGIEPSEAAVEAGTREHFNIYRGYGESMPFVDDFFDGVITNHVLEHVADPVALINECARVSRRVSIHIVSLGKRGDTMQINEYHTLEELRELGNNIVFPVKFDKTVYQNGVIIVSKTIRPIGIFKDYSDIVLVPDYVAQIGASVNQEDALPEDIDILVKKPTANKLLETEVTNRLKDGYSDRIKWIYQAGGAVGASSSLFDLVLRSKDVMITKENTADKAFLQKFAIPKPSQTFHLYKDEDIALMWDEWCEERKVVNVELKCAGFRAIIERDVDGKTLIFFDEDLEDKSRQFPMLVKEMQKINTPFIFDCDFNTIEETKGELKVTIFDILHYGKSVTHLAFTERRKILDSIPLEGLKLLNKAEIITVRSKDAFISIVKSHLEKDCSSGIIVKDLTGQYIGFGSNNIYCIKGQLFTWVHSGASGDIKRVRDGLILTKSKHSRDKCMQCDEIPIYECIWANGIGHAWFCKKHFKLWATTGDGKGDIDYVKEIKDGRAAKKFGDNSNPNIWKELKIEIEKK